MILSSKYSSVSMVRQVTSALGLQSITVFYLRAWVASALPSEDFSQSVQIIRYIPLFSLSSLASLALPIRILNWCGLLADITSTSRFFRRFLASSIIRDLKTTPIYLHVCEAKSNSNQTQNCSSSKLLVKFSAPVAFHGPVVVSRLFLWSHYLLNEVSGKFLRLSAFFFLLLHCPAPRIPPFRC